MGLFGGDSKTKTTTEPWKGVQPYLKDIYSRANQLYLNPMQQYYPGQTFAPMDPLQIGAQQLALSQVFGRSNLPSWWTPQMPNAQGQLTGSFAQPYNAPPLPLGASSAPALFGSIGGQQQQSQSIFDAYGNPQWGNGRTGGAGGAGMPTGFPPQQIPNPHAGQTWANEPWAQTIEPAQRGMPAGARMLSVQEMASKGISPGVAGGAYTGADGRTTMYGGAQTATSAAKQARLHRKKEIDRAKSSLSIDYDRATFSPKLNDFLNNRVPGFNSRSREQQNQFLNRLVGFSELYGPQKSALEAQGISWY